MFSNKGAIELEIHFFKANFSVFVMYDFTCFHNRMSNWEFGREP